MKYILNGKKNNKKSGKKYHSFYFMEYIKVY